MYLSKCIIALFLFNMVFSFFLYWFSIVTLDFNWCTPNSLYKKTKMNKFGCIMTLLILTLLLSFYFVPVLFGNFIYFLFHIGRKN